MKLATLRDGSPDGELVVVSRDLERAVPATDIARNLLTALESWPAAEPRLRALSAALERGSAARTIDFPNADVAPPLPRTWQWLDASAFKSHGELMARAFKQTFSDAQPGQPLM